jgi:hypothetical protein
MTRPEPPGRHRSWTPVSSVWPPLPPAVYLRRPTGSLPFPLDAPGCRLVARARHGIWLGVRAIGLRPGDEVLAPAWHHGSEIEALVRAGLRCRFYDATPSLAPDPGELERLLGPNVRALHLTHFLGFPQDAASWRRWCEERGLLLIEDAAQAWLGSFAGRPIGASGHLAVFCFYKTYGLADGSAYVIASPADADAAARDGRRRLGGRGTLRRHAAWLAGRSALVAAASRRRPAPPRADPLAGFALGEPRSAPALSSMWLLARLYDAQTAARRRTHYAKLLDALSNRVPAPFGELPDGASPFGLPLLTADKPRTLALLQRHGVAPLNFWSVPHPDLPPDGYPGAAALRAGVVVLPVHQELRACDLERIASAAGSSP